MQLFRRGPEDSGMVVAFSMSRFVERGPVPLESSRVGYEIVAYLAEHPDSSDTLEGIMQWWLLERKIECQITKIKEALLDLIDKGLIIEDKRMNSRTHYRLNQYKYEEIQMLLKDQLQGIKTN